ncbi:hypothetical protein TEA_007786 [Camellia sinensis var. sinensis]|uniref:Amidase domain-containing protein n=1 Tax=Camellia sinensis var. sinensis TaxID=542762 RepID=A0A4S4EEJ4_CAMSN|nr:hypothetical protein TEA_007786 [Camellia sinensis var. sinensis]
MSSSASMLNLQISLLLLISFALSLSVSQSSTYHVFSIKEASVVDLQNAFKQNQLTSRKLVEFYIGEIRRLNLVLRGVIEVNPDALYQADLADQQRKSKVPGLLYGLHGIPILLKNNIAIEDKLNTTAGSFALLKSIVPRDAGVVMKLRKARAIILGKASLSEWANFCSLAAPNGWSAIGGQVDPYGSSSGSAISVAVNMVAVSLGTETDGSILCPTSFNGVVGIKPTVGLTSRAGVIQVSPRQDTIGFDYCDAQATKEASKYIPRGGYMQFLKVDGLKGKRLGIVRNPFFNFANGSDLSQVFESHFQTEMIKEFGQEIFLVVDATNGIEDTEKNALLNLAKLTRYGFEKTMIENKLDALVTPRADAAPVLVIRGYPGISVLAGFDNNGVPFGIAFGGFKGSEPKLIEIAYGFEQATKIRKPPSFKP